MTESPQPVSSETPAAVVAAPAPLPEAWTVENPPAAAPRSVIFSVVAEEQLRAWQAHAEWLQQHLPLFERQVTAAGSNVASFSKQADAADRVAAMLAAEPTAAEQLWSMTVALACAPAMQDKPAAVVLERARSLVSLYRAIAPNFK